MSSPIYLPLKDGCFNNNSAPHILLILDQFPKSLGGGERIVLRLADLLPLYGYRVSILTFAIHPESAVLASPPACPVYLLPLHRTYGLTAFKAALVLRHFLRQQEVLIVQTFFESSDLWAGPIAKMFSHAKLIWSRRDMGILRGRKHLIAYRLFAKLPDKVFAVSEQVRRYCIEVDGIEPQRVKTIYNGLDIPLVSDVPCAFDPTNSVVITTVGNIRRVKGHDILIRAAALVVKHFPLVVFTVAGEVLEPDYLLELVKLVVQLNLGDQVRFLGEIKALDEHLRAADIFVLPSRSEGFSNAILEAMAARLPVVATDVGGNPEAVMHNKTGLIVPPEDPEGLAAAICQLLNSPGRALEMGLEGERRVNDCFTTKAMMLNISNSYASLLKR